MKEVETPQEYKVWVLLCHLSFSNPSFPSFFIAQCLLCLSHTLFQL
jgi:hypothetical protein